jgi:hypothetical protein
VKRLALASLPYLVAALVPTAILGALFSMSGQTPLYGLFGGGIALIGAMLAQIVRVAIANRAAEAELDAHFEWLRKEQERDEPPERG